VELRMNTSSDATCMNVASMGLRNPKAASPIPTPSMAASRCEGCSRGGLLMCVESSTARTTESERERQDRNAGDKTKCPVSAWT
jgi:hypothetical protein